MQASSPSRRSASPRVAPPLGSDAADRLEATAGRVDLRAERIRLMQGALAQVAGDDRIRATFEASLLSDDVRASNERVLAVSGIGLAAGVDRSRIQATRQAVAGKTVTQALLSERGIEDHGWIAGAISTDARYALIARIMPMTASNDPLRAERAATVIGHLSSEAT
jgi:hypothetical protein